MDSRLYTFADLQLECKADRRPTAEQDIKSQIEHLEFFLACKNLVEESKRDIAQRADALRRKLQEAKVVEGGEQKALPSRWIVTLVTTKSKRQLTKCTGMHCILAELPETIGSFVHSYNCAHPEDDPVDVSDVSVRYHAVRDGAER